MNADLGLLIDFLRGELGESAAAAVRRRLEDEAEFFALFERLRRTRAVLRSLPALQANGAPLVPPPSLPLTAPRPEFVADLEREFSARGLHGLLPLIQPSALFAARVRAELNARAWASCLPQLQPGVEFVAQLRDEFAVRATVARIPLAAVQPAWAAAVRASLNVHAAVAELPLLEPRPAFVASLRAEFAARCALPAMEVRDGFKRRLQVALFEDSRQAAAVAVPAAGSALPELKPSDSFRRRVFRRILMGSRRVLGSGRSQPEVQGRHSAREMRGLWRGAKRPISTTLAVHALAIVVLLFITLNQGFDGVAPIVAQLEGGSVPAPALPGARDLPAAPRFDAVSAGAGLGDPPPVFDEPGSVGLGQDDMPQMAPLRNEVELPQPPAPRRNAGLPLSSRDKTADQGAWFRLRSGSQREKIAYLGSAELMAALDRSLAWLQRNQAEDGAWGHVDVADPRVIPQDRALYGVQRIELTAAALLAFLGDGHSSKASPVQYDWSVKRGLEWLVKQQQPDGQIGDPAAPVVLVHAMATQALLEDYALTGDWKLKQPLRLACRWLAAARPADGGGGFPYRLGQPASPITGVWAYLALATAQNANVPDADAPKARMDELLAWFGESTRGFSTLKDAGEVLAANDLLPTAGAAALTAFAADAGYEMRRTVFLDRIGGEQPSLDIRKDRAKGVGDMRYVFFGSLAFALEQRRTGARTNQWQQVMAQSILQNQQTDHPLRTGSYAPTSDYADLYGRVFGAAYGALAIENAWRIAR
ncbi:MAG: terpene cyclase/mutase family protein [Planctomycetes bacterium]|nr:terpene cyclase/mutase family protein [Planctomycetota bacterium]